MKVLYKDKGDIDKDFKALLPGYYLGAMEKPTEAMRKAEVLSVKFSRVGKGTLQKMPNLKYIVLRAHGTDLVDMEACKKRGIKVIASYPTAREVSSCILYIIKKLRCKPTFTIFGNGSIGKLIVKKLNSPDIIDSKTSNKKIKEYLENTHTLISTVPLTSATKDLFNRNIFRHLPKRTVFISASRGETINNADLLKYIGNGKISYAVIDTLGPNLREKLLETGKVKHTGHTFWKHGFDKTRYLNSVKKAIDSIGRPNKKRLLLNLPYPASTNNYPRYFPYPLNLMAIKKPNDILLDINFRCYKKKKAEIYSILDLYAKKLRSGKAEFILNCGDYPPDGDKWEYFEYFIRRLNKPVTLHGPYLLFGDRIEALKKEGLEINTGKIFNDWSSVIIPKEMIESYPPVGNKLKVNINFTQGCPRKCNYCPVGPIYNQSYTIHPFYITLQKIYDYYKQGVRFFNFIDDNISASPHAFYKFLASLKVMIDNKKIKGVQFQSQEGLEVGALAHLKICKLLKATNFVDIKIGVENINTKFLKMVNKPYAKKAGLLDKALKNIKATNLSVTAYYLLGLNETRKEVMQNFKFIAKHKLGLRINIIRPYEGTEFIKMKFNKNLSDKELRELKSLGYAIAWLGSEKGIDVFHKNALTDILNKFKLNHARKTKKHIFTGKVYIGFATSKLIKILRLVLGLDSSYKVDHNKERIIFEK